MDKFQENQTNAAAAIGNSNNRNKSNNNVLTERFNLERLKALEVLKKCQELDSFTQNISNTNNSDYYPLRRPNSINISELVMEESITLDNSSLRHSQISFEPTEMTARSTLHQSDANTQSHPHPHRNSQRNQTLQQQFNSRERAARLSVSDILATSFAKKARDLSGKVSQNFSSNYTTGSSCSSFNLTHSLPRTADMSRSKDSILSLNGIGNTFSFSAAAAVAKAENDMSDLCGEEFAPGELMCSKLLNDEIAWAQEYAAIPIAALSEQAKEKVGAGGNKCELTRELDSIIESSPNFSVGSFFNKRSDDISNIVQAKSPEKPRKPIALIDLTHDSFDDTVSTTTTEAAAAANADLDLTGTTSNNNNNNDNKTVTIVNESTIILNKDKIEEHESKDSGNSTETSYMLTLSAIDRALCNLNIETDDNESYVVNHLKANAKKNQKSANSKPTVAPPPPPSPAASSRRAKSIQPFADNNGNALKIATATIKSGSSKEQQQQQQQQRILQTTAASFFIENKENLDPQAMRGINFSDTASFTESLLNSSEMKQLQRNSNNSSSGGSSGAQQKRLPLSPIENQITVPQINVIDVDNDADIDEWPSTPVQAKKRQTRYLKITNDKSPNYVQENNATGTITSRKSPDICRKSPDLCRKSPDLCRKSPDLCRKSPDLCRKSPEVPINVCRKSAALNAKQSPTSLQKSPETIKKSNPTAGNSAATSAISSSLTSTRLENDKTVNVELNFDNSPNPIMKTSMLLNRSSNNSSPVTNYEISPMSSPRSGLSSQTSSPINEGFHSPQLDTTTNSDRRCLGGTTSVASVYKTASSPASSYRSNSSSNNNNNNRLQHYNNNSNSNNNNNNNNYNNNYNRCTNMGYYNIYGAMPMLRTMSTNLFRSTSNLAVGGSGAMGIGISSGRSISSCSNTSEFSHRDGKIIPLKVTTLELSWGSTKLRKEIEKSMQVKNISNKRLVLRIEIHGPGFKIVNHSQGNTLTLQSQECRTINIGFCPTVIGAAIGVLSFYSPLGSSTQSTSFLDIPLYGFGGHSSITPQDIVYVPVGFPLLPLGDLRDLMHCNAIERTFKIYNRGPLHGFAIINIDSNGLNLPRLCDTIEIWPQTVLIPADTFTNVRVIFRPKRDDLKKIIKKITNVLTLANMRIICGDEANRQRMRRLVKQMRPEEHEKIASNTLDLLWKKLPNEIEMEELEELNEQPNVVADLLTTLRIFELAITLNNEALDESNDVSTLLYPDDDDTVLFRTVCVTSPIIEYQQPREQQQQQQLLPTVNEMHETAANSKISLNVDDVIVGVDDEHVVSSTHDINNEQ